MPKGKEQAGMRKSKRSGGDGSGTQAAPTEQPKRRRVVKRIAAGGRDRKYPPRPVLLLCPLVVSVHVNSWHL